MTPADDQECGQAAARLAHTALTFATAMHPADPRAAMGLALELLSAAVATMAASIIRSSPAAKAQHAQIAGAAAAADQTFRRHLNAILKANPA